MTLRPIGVMSLLLLLASSGALVACSDAPSAAENDLGSAPSEGEASDDDTLSAPIVDGVRAGSYVESALVDMYQRGRQFAICSGSVIAPRVVLTAGHCVDGADSFRVTTPFASNQRSVSVGAAVYDWRNNGSGTVDPNLHDIGLIFLKDPINLPSYPRLAGSQQPDGTRAINVGRIRNNRPSSTELFQGRVVSLRDGRRVGFPLSYASEEVIQSGDSGGPVFLADGNAQHTIVAVNSGGGTGTQVLARVDLLINWINQKVRENGGGGGGGGGGSTGGGSTGGGSTGGGSTGGTTGGGSTGAGSTGGGGSTTGGGTGGGSCNGTPESGRNGSYQSPDPITQIGQVYCGSLGRDEESWFTFGLTGSGIVYDVQVAGGGDAAVGVWKETSTGYRRIENDSAQRVRRSSVSGSKYLVAVFSPSGTAQPFTLKFDASR